MVTISYTTAPGNNKKFRIFFDLSWTISRTILKLKNKHKSIASPTVLFASLKYVVKLFVHTVMRSLRAML